MRKKLTHLTEVIVPYLKDSIMKSTSGKIIILDATLRDGDQSPGMSFSADEKIEIALLLEKLGVDIVEAGFPGSPDKEFEIVRDIAALIKNSEVSVMARAIPDDISRAAESIKAAARKRIHLTIATSPEHRNYMLKMSKEKILRIAAESVEFARSFADTVEISAEDSTKTEFKFLCEFCEAATGAGADVVNISDTTGYSQTGEFSRLIKNLLKNVQAFRDGRSIISVNCHNDLGMATANTLTGILSGALQAETTLLGIGERAGNAALEEIAAAIKTRESYYRIKTGIRSEYFPQAARIISRINAIRPHPCKPVVGSNTYINRSGIHQHDMIVKSKTYTVPDLSKEYPSRFTLSRNPGLDGLKEQIRRMSGREIGDNDVHDLLPIFNEEANKKKTISSTDLLTILYKKGLVDSQIWSLKKIYYFDIKSWDRHEFSLFLEFTDQDGQEKWVNTIEATKWEAVKKALRSAFHFDIKVIEYSSSMFADEHYLSERFRLEAEFEDNVYTDEIFGSDSIILYVESYLNIVNQIIARYQFAAGTA